MHYDLWSPFEHNFINLERRLRRKRRFQTNIFNNKCSDSTRKDQWATFPIHSSSSHFTVSPKSERNRSNSQELVDSFIIEVIPYLTNTATKQSSYLRLLHHGNWLFDFNFTVLWKSFCQRLFGLKLTKIMKFSNSCSCKVLYSTNMNSAVVNIYQWRIKWGLFVAVKNLFTSKPSKKSDFIYCFHARPTDLVRRCFWSDICFVYVMWQGQEISMANYP